MSKEQRTFASIPVDHIVPNSDNPNRHTEGELNQLALNIRHYGLINPITVSPVERERYRIIAGEARWRACQRAGFKEIPCLVDFGHDEKEATGKRFSENRLRKSDWVVDCREAARLKAEGLSHDEIAERFGLVEVKKYIAVGFYPDEVWEILRRVHTLQNLAFYQDVQPSLTLRIPPAFGIQFTKGGHASTEFTTEDYAKFDYTEVINYFQKIADGTLDTREKRDEYILERRQGIIQAVIELKQMEIAQSLVEEESQKQTKVLLERLTRLEADRSRLQKKLGLLEQARWDEEAKRKFIRDNRSVAFEGLVRTLGSDFNKLGRTIGALEFEGYVDQFTRENVRQISGMIEVNVITLERFLHRLEDVAKGADPKKVFLPLEKEVPQDA